MVFDGPLCERSVRLKRISLLLMMILVLASTSGCFLVLAGAGAAAGVGYAKGDLEATLTDDLKEVFEATLGALGQLQMPVVHKNRTALDAEIRSLTAQDKKVKIVLMYPSPLSRQKSLIS